MKIIHDGVGGDFDNTHVAHDIGDDVTMTFVT
jgi:hypothetical protein